MRRIYDNDNPEEAAEREAIVAKIDARRRAFEGQMGQVKTLFNQETRWDLPRWMEDHLHPIHPEMMWEYGPAIRGDGHRLVLKPESARELRPLVIKILKRGPSIPAWELDDARFLEVLDSTKATVSGRSSHDIDVFLFRASVGNKRLIDSELASEWVAFHEEMPAPPGRLATRGPRVGGRPGDKRRVRIA